MIRPVLTTCAAILLGLCWASSASAQTLDNFQFRGIEGKGALKGNLDERLGTTVGATEHRINIADCDVYAGGEVTMTVRVSPVPSDAQVTVAYAPPGASCDTDDTSITNADCESTNISDRVFSTSDLVFDIEMDKLIGGDCATTEDGLARVYVIVSQTPLIGDPTVSHQAIEFDIDLEAPAVPVLTSVTGGDGRFTVKWTDDVNDDDETSYIVYYDEVDFTAAALQTVNKKDGIETNSIDVEDGVLVNGITYYVRVAAEDLAENMSDLSDVISVVPIETQDFWEAYKQAGGTEDGGFCFIATAAFGSPLASELVTLRRFRDEVLMTSGSGRAFVAGYYKWGRFAAAWIADKPALRAVVRVLLVPLVWLAKLMLAFGPFGALALLVTGAFALTWARRRLVGWLLRDVPEPLPTTPQTEVRA